MTSRFHPGDPKLIDLVIPLEDTTPAGPGNPGIATPPAPLDQGHAVCLDPFVGSAWVADVTGRGPVSERDIEAAAAIPAKTDRLLLEGLRLEHVGPGAWTPVCIPLQLTGLDAASAHTLLLREASLSV